MERQQLLQTTQDRPVIHQTEEDDGHQDGNAMSRAFFKQSPMDNSETKKIERYENKGFFSTVLSDFFGTKKNNTRNVHGFTCDIVLVCFLVFNFCLFTKLADGLPTISEKQLSTYHIIPSARNIRHLPCISRRTKEEGICMFAIDCLKANGTHLGTCIDRFYFGSCCQMPDDSDPTIDNSIEDDTILAKPVQQPVNVTKVSVSSTTITQKPTYDTKRNTTTKLPPSTHYITKKPTTTVTKVSTTIKTTTKINNTTNDKSPELIPSLKPSRHNVSSSRPTTTSKPFYLPSRFTTTQPTLTEVTTQTTIYINNNLYNATKATYTPTRRPTTTTTTTTTDVPFKISTFQTVQGNQASSTIKSPTTNFIIKQPTPSQKPDSSLPFGTRLPSTTPSSSTTTQDKPKKPTTTLTTQPQKPVRPTAGQKPIRPVVQLNTTTTTQRPPIKRPQNSTLSNRRTTTVKPTTPLIKPTTSSSTLTATTQKPTTIVYRPFTDISKPTNTHKPVNHTQTTATRRPTLQTKRPILNETKIEESSTKPIKSTSKPNVTLTTISSTSTTISLSTEDTKKPPSKRPQTTTISPLTNEVDGPITNKPTTAQKPSTTTEKLGLVTWSSLENDNVTQSSVINVANETGWSPGTPPPNWVLLQTLSPETENVTGPTVQPSHTIQPSKKPIITTPKPIVTTMLSNTSSEEEFSTFMYVSGSPTTLPTKVSTVQNATTPAPNITTTLSTNTTEDIDIANTTDVFGNGTESTEDGLSTEKSTVSPIEVITSTGPPLVSSDSVNMSDYTDVCGRRLWPEGRIVGGARSSFGRWPWQISLRQWRTSTYLHKCGAALLNENWAITAAHCVDSVPPSDLLLRLGEHDLGNEEEPYGFQERRVQIVASHPQFDPRTFEYDLALLRFYEPVTFQPNILPVCVPTDDDRFIGKNAYVTGWGRLYEDGPLPSVLQEVTVPVIENSACESMYRSAGYIEHIPQIFICAGWKKGGFDSCEGDSGGPMVLQRSDKRFLLAGVISWGIGCAEPNQPGVYTRISHFRHWINQILQF